MANLTTYETIIAADIAITRLIDLIVRMAADSGDDQTVEQLKASADEMDARRAAVMAKIRGH